MSFKDAEPHVTAALAHIKGGNAAKAMHRIGHAMVHLKGMTSSASTSGPAKAALKSDSPMGKGDPLNFGGKPSGGGMDMGGGGMPMHDAGDPSANDPNTSKASKTSKSGAMSLRSRLAGMRK